MVRGLRSAGFDCRSLANNHVGDYGDRAPRQTMDRLKAADLLYGGRPQPDRSPETVVLTRDGVHIALFATDSIGETPAATSRRPAPTG